MTSAQLSRNPRAGKVFLDHGPTPALTPARAALLALMREYERVTFEPPTLVEVQKLASVLILLPSLILFRRAGTQDKPGQGIGLAHVRALVRRLGGTMSVSSELNNGSTFTITLPIAWASSNRNRDN